MTEMHDSDRLPKKRIFIARGLALIGGLASGCAGIGRTSAPLAPPITLPVPLHKAGARIETDIRIVEDRSYRFVFPLMFKTPDQRTMLNAGRDEGSHPMPCATFHEHLARVIS